MLKLALIIHHTMETWISEIYDFMSLDWLAVSVKVHRVKLILLLKAEFRVDPKMDHLKTWVRIVHEKVTY